MNWRKTCGLLLVMLVGINVVGAVNEKPNVVFFLVDDFGWGALSSMGSDFHETPNIDKLAKSGMAFSNGYAACTAVSYTHLTLPTICSV